MPSKIGLTDAQAKELLKEHGPNEIRRTKKAQAWKIFLSQFASPLILILIAAAAISFFIGPTDGMGHVDTVLILIIVFASGLAGFFQEYKSERAIEALQGMAKPRAIVLRDGKETEVSASEIVPGDIALLEGGDVVPADGEIIEGKLELDESVLTGESRAVHKKAEGCVFSGTAVYSGRAKVLVKKTGMETEVGRLAEKMQSIKEDKSPFQRQIGGLGRRICYSVAALLLLMVLVRYIRFGAGDLTMSFLIAVSLAVAAIPEGLPAVLTIGLSRGAGVMAKKNALVRKLNVVESIGTINTICTDKTGTITEGRLKVREFVLEGRKVSGTKEPIIARCAVLCNDAKKVSKNGKVVWAGDENDVALADYFEGPVRDAYVRIDEVPFSSERKMQTVVCGLGGVIEVFSKGAPEVILPKCDRVFDGGKFVKMTDSARRRIGEETDALTGMGRRVLALAYRKGGVKPYENRLVWLGLVSFSDPPRPEVKEAIRECRESGIRTIMITGDNPKTAVAVAKEIGLETSGAITGDELDSMDNDALEEALGHTSVFARTNPMHKLRILEVLQKQGHIVAMTGDGVNDSLAVKKADVGISMGIKGTEVTKEVSDII
ncbi:MAG: cation-translocating P-type ATPase, partial [Candidatus Aenigmatarchaeota archaeon]